MKVELKARYQNMTDVLNDLETYEKRSKAGITGLEAAYSWIEGLSVTGRVGVRRPETKDEKPVSLGGAFTADRLTLEYALQMFDSSKRSHMVTIRWR